MDAIRKIEELTALTERLKLEAQMHAQEAATANATIAEIYQLCTGATGEPGNWNGAEPVRQTLASKEAELVRLREALTEIAERETPVKDGLSDFGESWNKGLFIGTLKDIARKALKRRALTQPTE